MTRAETKAETINRLMGERDDAVGVIRETRDALRDMLHYLQSPKFHGVDNDYVHVSSDAAPKLMAIYHSLCGQ